MPECLRLGNSQENVAMPCQFRTGPENCRLVRKLRLLLRAFLSVLAMSLVYSVWGFAQSTTQKKAPAGANGAPSTNPTPGYQPSPNTKNQRSATPAPNYTAPERTQVRSQNLSQASTSPRPSSGRPSDTPRTVFNSGAVAPQPKSATSNTPRSTGTTPSVTGATTYTPHSSAVSAPRSDVSTSNGVTTFTPHSAGVFSPQSASTNAASRNSVAPNPGLALHTVYKAPAGASITGKTPAGASVLDSTGSQAVLREVNSARGGMQGVNRSPIPPGNVTMHHNGNLTVQTAAGSQYILRGNGTLASYTSQGRSVGFWPSGRVSMMHTEQMDIQHGVHGERTIVSRLPDKSILVSTGPHNGYLERNIVVANRTYISRTYVVGGITQNRIFASYQYRGVLLPLFVPRVYYVPAFYGWAYYPWASSVAYTWAWTGNPWYGFYGSYFTPYPVYSSGFAWLTDYYLAQTMAAAYAEQVPDRPAAEPMPTGEQPSSNMTYAQSDTPVTPELKAAIAQEVQRQLAYQSAVAAGTVQPDSEAGQLSASLKPNRVFVVGSSLDVTTTDEQECSLTPGDVLQLYQPPSDDSPLVEFRVASSKRASCPVGAEVGLSLQDVAEMQNNMRAQVDAGLAALRSNQGRGGLPTAPENVIALPPRPSMPDVPSGGDSNVAALIDKQQQDAERTESSVMQTAFASQKRAQ